MKNWMEGEAELRQKVLAHFYEQDQIWLCFYCKTF